MDPTALVIIFVELLNKVDQQKIFNIKITLFASGRKRFNFHMYSNKEQWLTETDAVTLLRQSRSIVPVSAWLTESKPSCFKTRVLLLVLPRKTSPLYKIGKFRHLLAYIGRFVFPIREPGRLYQNRESPGEIGRLERSDKVGLLMGCFRLNVPCVLRTVNFRLLSRRSS